MLVLYVTVGIIWAVIFALLQSLVYSPFMSGKSLAKFMVWSFPVNAVAWPFVMLFLTWYFIENV